MTKTFKVVLYRPMAEQIVKADTAKDARRIAQAGKDRWQSTKEPLTFGVLSVK